jgi:HD superfamily phosphohydrolase
MTSKEVRDPIHGLIELTPSEWKIVDSPAFQRLRSVQQLAFTHLVYPGARHSRFEHCLGAGYIAGRVADTLGVDSAPLRAAGLCHDLGHGPFSHVSEMVYEKRTGREHIHEAIGAAVVRHHQPIRKALGKELSEWVAELLSGEGHGAKRSFSRDVIAGPADVDKLDYLLRDSHFCGVNYGRFDMHKVVESMRRLEDVGGTYLGFDAEGIYAVEELLLARYHMHRQVYGHRTRIATDKMLVRSMIFGVEEGLLPKEVFTPPEIPDEDYVREYLCWDDHRVVRTLLDAPENSPARQMMKSLMDRNLLKEAARFDRSELEADLGTAHSGYALKPQDLDSVLPEAEQLVAEAAGVDPMWVVFHWESLKSPIVSQDDVILGSGQIPIVTRSGLVQPLNMTSDIFGATETRPRLAICAYIKPPAERGFGVRAKKRIADAFKDALVLIAEHSASQ